jgi:hypothetical protein
MSNPYSSHSDEPYAAFAYPKLYNVVYCSRATARVDAAVVDQIIATAHRLNPPHGITGILVFGNGIFVQWLEGPRDNVLALMANIRVDSRHEEIVLISESEEVRERLFPDWDMELVTGDHIREVLLDARESASDPESAATLDRLLADLDEGLLLGSEAG